MLYWLKRHPIPIKAFFKNSIVLTYALPKEILIPLLPPGLVLDSYKRGHQTYGFIAISLIQTQNLRPAFFPSFLGNDFFLSGYRLFTRYKNAQGKWKRGFKILRSDADHRTMACLGNLLTHFNYQLADVRIKKTGSSLSIKVHSSYNQANLEVEAYLDSIPAPLPKGSIFSNSCEANRFSGESPFIFDYEKQTHSIISMEGLRPKRKASPISVKVSRLSFFSQRPFQGSRPILSQAFFLENIPFTLKPGNLEKLNLGIY